MSSRGTGAFHESEDTGQERTVLPFDLRDVPPNEQN